MTGAEPIPFLDFVSQHVALEPELLEVFRRAIGTAGFVGGPMVEEFERAFAAFCDVRHAVGVGNGTEALLFALVAAGVRPGDVVLTVPHTFIATVEAIQSGRGRRRVRRHRRAHVQHEARRRSARVPGRRVPRI